MIYRLWGALYSGPWRRLSHARAYQVLREGALGHGQRRLVPVQPAEQDFPEPVVHAEVVRQTAPEVVPEDEAAARLAARDRLAVPGLHARGAPGDSRRQERRQRVAQR